jgi:hydrogenase expression/formation protein HypC
MCLAVAGRIVAITSLAPQPAGAPLAGAQPAQAEDSLQPEAVLGLWLEAEVDFGGVRQQVSLACLPEARLGDRVLVHVGLALTVVLDDEDETTGEEP